MKPNLQHALERVERPGGSHEGVGRKKFAHVANASSSRVAKMPVQKNKRSPQKSSTMFKTLTCKTS